MKPPLFDYVPATSVAEAIEARGRYGSTAVLAGGQSLIPALNLHLAFPDALIDISRIAGLKTLRVEAGAVRVGAMVRARELELSPQAHAANPLLREVLRHVAHVPIRNRGTVCGSLAHADAAAEMPAVLVALGGHVRVEGPDGAREVAADDLFQFHMTTSLGPQDIVTEAVFPALAKGAGYGFEELARRRGDYALAGVCAVVTRAGGAAAQVAACGIAERPVRLAAVEAALAGSDLSDGAIAEAAAEAAQYVTNEDDGTGGAYRRRLAVALTRRALARAAARAA
jgi:carbon-monoxide dehydrogenase medium subunit